MSRTKLRIRGVLPPDPFHGKMKMNLPKEILSTGQNSRISDLSLNYDRNHVQMKIGTES